VAALLEETLAEEEGAGDALSSMAEESIDSKAMMKGEE
jgi:ferritin-like metal-binding protein YciE